MILATDSIRFICAGVAASLRRHSASASSALALSRVVNSFSILPCSLD
jgi:hypothetical protein